ncbi:hypothetical protein E0494_04590 [Marinilabiliaceae bacterium JC040]|nr:hypothetical protein [Marinilabiliaceae bacterium JC040]
MKKIIASIREENTDYNNPAQAVNQADSLDKLSSDIYSESQRFIYELIQNADDSVSDSQNVEIEIKLINNYLILSHSGKPFSERDMRGLCGVGNGTKRKDATKTGYKGIGFKSVFGKSDLVYVRSENILIKFDKNKANDFWKWDSETRDSFERSRDRIFSMPWQIIPFEVIEKEIPNELLNTSSKYKVSTTLKYNNLYEIEEEILNLLSKPELLLFLRNVTEIKFVGSEKLIINKSNASDKIDLFVNQVKRSSWILKKSELTIPESTRQKLLDDNKCPEKLQNSESTELVLAVQVDGDSIVDIASDDRLLYTYLPTSVNCNFNFLVNGNFLTDAGRQKLHDESSWNNWLISKIPSVAIEWMAELAFTKYRPNYLSILPKESIIISSKLKRSYLQGLNYSKSEIPFILNDERKLLKVEEIVIDYTTISKNIDKHLLLTYLNSDNDVYKEEGLIQFRKELEEQNELEFKIFEVKDLKDFFRSDIFKENHSLRDNFQLILFLYNQYVELHNEDKKREWIYYFSEIEFIFNQDRRLKSPNELYFKSLDDNEENDTKVSYINDQIAEKISQESKIEEWLEILGLKYKTDVSFIEKTLLGNSNYINKSNAIEIGRFIFNTIRNNKLSDETLKYLGKIKILTTNGELIRAQDAYLSNKYQPQFELENYFKSSMYVSEEYIRDGDVISDWKSLFVKIGVQESLDLRRISVGRFSNEDTNIIDQEYINLYRRGINEYPSRNGSIYYISFSRYNVCTVPYIHLANEIEFSKYIWGVTLNQDVQNIIDCYDYAEGKRGFYEDSEELHEKYFSWLIKTKKIIPTSLGSCEIAKNVFRNTDDIKQFGENYIPIFDIENPISDKWANYLGLKQNLELKDYLSILEKISIEKECKDKLKRREIVQNIYNKIISDYSNNFEEIQEWALNNKILTSTETFDYASNLNFFLDIPEINNDKMIQLSIKDIDKETALNFLDILGVKIYRSSDFDIKYINPSNDNILKRKLFSILPYLVQYIDMKFAKGFNSIYSSLENELEYLQINKAESINYYLKDKKINSSKSYLNKDTKEFFYCGNLSSKRILLNVSNELLPYFYNKKIDLDIKELFLFLLQEDDFNEIQLYFDDKDIKISEDCKEKILSIQQKIETNISNGIEKNSTSNRYVINNELESILDYLKDKGISSFEAFKKRFLDYDDAPTYSNYTDLSKNERYQYNKDAYRSVKKILEDEGYIFKESYNGSVVNGVYKNGKEYPMVIKSYQNSSFELNIKPNEWNQLDKENSLFILWSDDLGIRYVNFENLLNENKKFHIEFSLEAFSSKKSLSDFINIFYENRVKGVKIQIPNVTENSIYDIETIFLRNKNYEGVSMVDSLDQL